jgi:hypothetical protein
VALFPVQRFRPFPHFNFIPMHPIPDELPGVTRRHRRAHVFRNSLCLLYDLFILLLALWDR